MVSQKGKITFIIALICIIGGIFVIIASLQPITSIGEKFMSNQPTPQITYGEFPFKLTYKINGELFIIEDTIICEYSGTGWDEGQGKHRKWERNLASGNNEVILLQLKDGTKIHYPIGSANFYMGDLEDYESFDFTFPNAFIYEKKGDNFYNRQITDKELLAIYKIELISWDYTEPVTNSLVD